MGIRGGVVFSIIAALWEAPIAACSYDSTFLIYADNDLYSFVEGGVAAFPGWVEQSFS